MIIFFLEHVKSMVLFIKIKILNFGFICHIIVKKYSLIGLEDSFEQPTLHSSILRFFGEEWKFMIFWFHFQIYYDLKLKNDKIKQNNVDQIEFKEWEKMLDVTRLKYHRWWLVGWPCSWVHCIDNGYNWILVGCMPWRLNDLFVWQWSWAWWGPPWAI